MPIDLGGTQYGGSFVPLIEILIAISLGFLPVQDDHLQRARENSIPRRGRLSRAVVLMLIVAMLISIFGNRFINELAVMLGATLISMVKDHT